MAKFVALLLTVLILWLQFHIWFGEASETKQITLQKEIADQTKYNEQLKKQNMALEKEIYLVRHDPKILEEKARESLGLVKKDEIFYRIIPSHSKE